MYATQEYVPKPVAGEYSQESRWLRVPGCHDHISETMFLKEPTAVSQYRMQHDLLPLRGGGFLSGLSPLAVCA